MTPERRLACFSIGEAVAEVRDMNCGPMDREARELTAQIAQCLLWEMGFLVGDAEKPSRLEEFAALTAKAKAWRQRRAASDGRAEGSISTERM